MLFFLAFTFSKDSTCLPCLVLLACCLLLVATCFFVLGHFWKKKQRLTFFIFHISFSTSPVPLGSIRAVLLFDNGSISDAASVVGLFTSIRNFSEKCWSFRSHQTSRQQEDSFTSCQHSSQCRCCWWLQIDIIFSGCCVVRSNTVCCRRNRCHIGRYHDSLSSFPSLPPFISLPFFNALLDCVRKQLVHLLIYGMPIRPRGD